MLLSSENSNIGTCDPLIWHLIEARDIAIATGLTETAETIERAIAISIREFKAAAPAGPPHFIDVWE